MGNGRRTCLAAVLIPILAILCVFAQPALASPVVSIEPSYQKVLQGQNFSVNITVDPAGAEVMGAQYTLYFNNTLLNATKQDKCPFLSQDGASTNIFANKINNTLGMTEYGEARIGVDYGVTSPGVLATITFRAMEPGICSLNLPNVKLSDPSAQPIPGVMVNNGSVEINESLFIISGFVSYNDGSPVNNPGVKITNLNTSEVFTAGTNESSNHYRVSTNLLHISEGNLLHFNASDNIGNSTEFNHTVTREEINAGGFAQNITIYVPDTTPPVITNVSAISIRKDSATITWETDEQSDSMVKYGTEPGNYTEIVYNASPVLHHCIVLSGLSPNTTYYYVVNSTDGSNNSAQSSEYSFKTFAEIIISIGDAGALSGENATTSIIISDITNVGTADIIITYNQSIVHVIAVNSSDFDFIDAVIDNSTGITRIGAFQTASAGLNGEVLLANVTLKAVGNGGESSALNISIIELKEASSEEISIPATPHNGTFIIGEITPPVVTNPDASPASIPEDTDSEPGWGETSQLNITVTDDCGVASVTINLTPIGGPPDQPMTRIHGTDIWTVTVNASAGTSLYHNGSYLSHNLTVYATDIFGNVNASVSIPLMVIQNGDVSENGNVTLYDAMYLAKHVLGKPGFETMNEGIGEVSGNNEVSLYDAMFLAKHVMGESGFEILH
ncbi:MAG: hypothetical protein DRP16_04630 [Candidatus Aenigmatarchaeota archaeon]|nr:MAG: hypothetical protein DRP16_04630 [Candidatus Aenigmarchaeota archaeon]